MLVLRLSKALLVLLVGFFGILVAVNNLSDYAANLAFVQHVMTMDTTYPDNALMGRAVENPAVHHAVYWLIIAGELVFGVLCIWGAWNLAAASQKSLSAFIEAKQVAILGLTIGVFLWFFGFVIVAAEWFLSWQSDQWDGTEAAVRFLVCTGIVLLFVAQNEPDADA